MMGKQPAICSMDLCTHCMQSVRCEKDAGIFEKKSVSPRIRTITVEL